MNSGDATKRLPSSVFGGPEDRLTRPGRFGGGGGWTAFGASGNGGGATGAARRETRHVVFLPCAPLGNDPDSSRVADIIADDAALMPWDGVSKETNAELVRELVDTLNAREQKILRERFALDGGEPRTLEDIGTDFGLTRERIRQLEAAALKKLRDRLRARDSLHSPGG